MTAYLYVIFGGSIRKASIHLDFTFQEHGTGESFVTSVSAVGLEPQESSDDGSECRETQEPTSSGMSAFCSVLLATLLFWLRQSRGESESTRGRGSGLRTEQQCLESFGVPENLASVCIRMLSGISGNLFPSLVQNKDVAVWVVAGRQTTTFFIDFVDLLLFLLLHKFSHLIGWTNKLEQDAGKTGIHKSS